MGVVLGPRTASGEGSLARPSCSSMSGLAAMCIGGEQVDGETIAQGGDALGDAVDENAIQGERAVDVCDEVLEAQRVAARDGDFDHRADYTVGGWARR